MVVMRTISLINYWSELFIHFFCLFFFFKAKNDSINDFTTLHKHYDLILTLQFYIKRSHTTYFPEKNEKQYVDYALQQKYTNNNNRQREKRVGG